MRRKSPAVFDAPSCALWMCSRPIGVFLQASLSALLQQFSAVPESWGLCVAGEQDLVALERDMLFWISPYIVQSLSEA